MENLIEKDKYFALLASLGIKRELDYEYLYSLFSYAMSGLDEMRGDNPQKINILSQAEMIQQAKKEKHTIYSPPFNSEGSFTETNDLFSYNLDEIHTEEWNIWLISSLNTNWFSYSDSYTANSNEIIFSLCSIISANSGNLSYGNLIDNITLINNDTNYLTNSSFEDLTTTNSYYHFNAENSSSPNSGIGWSSTATDKKVEVGNFEKGKEGGKEETE